MSQCKHRQQRSIPGFIAEVILEFTACQLRTGGRFGGDETCFLSFKDGMAHEWECDTAEIGTAAKARDNRVGIFTGHFHLFLGFQSDYSLMQGDVAQYGAECIFTVGSGACQFDSLGNSRTQ